jgi:DNA-directed RNA polymerase specialized sigma24 family protein
MNAKHIEALRAFYVGNRQQLYTYAVSITRNREAAEDAMHGVLEKLLRGATLAEELRPYIFRSVRNAAFDGARRTKFRFDSLFGTAPKTRTSKGAAAVATLNPPAFATPAAIQSNPR